VLQDAIATVAELAVQRHAASATRLHEFANAGLLMSYLSSQTAIARRAAAYVDKVLKGASAGDLPVEQPTVFDLAVNVKTLEALGLTIPPSVKPLVTERIQ